MNPSIQDMLEQLMSTGQIPPELQAAIADALSDPSKLDELLAQLQAMGANEMGSGPPLNIADYYKPGPGRYELRWELPAHLPLPVSFDELDRETQFFVLFQEWTRRELDGMTALNGGDPDGAEEIFGECLERATQIDVDELKARSYEGMMRVAQRRGDRESERSWLEKAAAARGG